MKKLSERSKMKNKVKPAKRSKIYKVKPASVCGSELEWTFANGVLTISGNGEIPDYESRLPWYSFREKIKKIVFKGNISKKCVYVFSNCENLTSVTFDGCTVPHLPFGSLNAKKSIQRDDFYRGTNFEFSINSNIIYHSLNAKDIIDRALQGYTLGDIWNIRSWFPLQMTRMLQEYKQKSACCLPVGMSRQEWNAILERMIFCFSEIGQPFSPIEKIKKRAYLEKMKNEGLELFSKYFWHLWW
jgi:hypothetical protein